MTVMEDKIFQLTLNTENDAFSPCKGDEIVRLLRHIADKIEKHDVGFYTETVYDLNGNSVGSYALKHRRDWPTKF